ncbi:MAG: protein kinase [Planctomycetes bacterium]|nr:protein kinase [Planctomycetota bacterium]
MDESEERLAERAVAEGFVRAEDLAECRQERRRQRREGLDVSLRELLFERAGLDPTTWRQLVLRKTRAHTVQDTHSDMEELPAPLRQETLGAYRLQREIGRGAMGVVYEAVQVGLGRRVALKVLPRTQGIVGTARERFRREAEATASLRHPGIVPIYDIGEDRGVLYFAMELVEGRSLRAALDQDGRLVPQVAAELGRQIAEALACAHAEGIVHRDVKPDNVLLRGDGRPVLTDFGLARRQQDAALTRVGTIVGTPLYMSPEQALGEPFDARTDVYSLGVTLYEALSGRAPFEGSVDTAQVLDRLVKEDPPPLRALRPEIPAALAGVVETALERDPARRYSSAGAFAEDLGRFLRGEPTLARPLGRVRRLARRLRRYRGPLAIGVLAAVLALGAGWIARTASRRWSAGELLLEAIRLEEAGDLEQAEDMLDRSIALWPSDAEAHLRKANLLLARDDVPAALRQLDLALARDPSNAGGLMARGALLESQGKRGLALADFRAATRADPGDPRAALAEGLLLHRDGRLAEALRLLPPAIKAARAADAVGGRYPLAVLALGEARLADGELDEAAALLEEASRLLIDDARPRLGLCRALLAQGRASEALEIADGAVRRDPASPFCYALRAEVHVAGKDYNAALEDLDHAEDLPAARLLRGRIRFLVHDVAANDFADAGAEADLRYALRGDAIAPADRANAWTILGRLELLGRRPQPSKARSCFQTALELAPGALAPQSGLAELALREGLLDEAEGLFQAMQAIPLGAYAGHVGLGRVAWARGDLTQARAELDAAIVAAPERSAAYGYRYRLRLELGDPDAIADQQEHIRCNQRIELLPHSLATDTLELAEQSSAQGRRFFVRLLRALESDAGVDWAREIESSRVWLSRALAFDPNLLEARAYLGSMCYLQGRYETAAEHYAVLAEQDPHRVRALLSLAAIERDLRRQPDVGLQIMDEALAGGAWSPRDESELRLERARCLQGLGRYAEALTELDRERTLGPPRHAVATLRVQLLRALKSEALPAAIERSIELFYEGYRDPRRALVFNTAARELHVRNRLPEATHFANRGIAADPRAPLGWTVRSNSRIENGADELAGAVADLFVASELDPKLTRHYWEIEQRLLNFPQLFPLLQAGVQRLRVSRPDFAVGWFLQGYAFFRLGSYDEALDWFEQAQAMCRGRSYVAQCYIAACYIKVRRLDDARAALAKADSLLEGGPLSSYWRACLDALSGDLDAARGRLLQLIRGGSLREAQLKNVPELGPLQSDPELFEALRLR